jgi:hypothetical protein
LCSLWFISNILRMGKFYNLFNLISYPLTASHS